MKSDMESHYTTQRFRAKRDALMKRLYADAAAAATKWLAVARPGEPPITPDEISVTEPTKMGNQSAYVNRGDLVAVTATGPLHRSAMAAVLALTSWLEERAIRDLKGPERAKAIGRDWAERTAAALPAGKAPSGDVFGRYTLDEIGEPFALVLDDESSEEETTRLAETCRAAAEARWAELVEEASRRRIFEDVLFAVPRVTAIEQNGTSRTFAVRASVAANRATSDQCSPTERREDLVVAAASALVALMYLDAKT